MTTEERIEELQHAAGSVYRVRMGSSYSDLGATGANEIALAEALLARAIKRAKGEQVPPLPRVLREIREELRS